MLEEALPGHDFEGELLGAQLRRGFPWHTPEVPHPELSSPDLWWDALLPVFVRAVLRDLSSRGWPHLILSNHVPELPEILHALGLDEHLLQVFNSAESGFEKPHPWAFDGVLETVACAEAAWVVGDNLRVDVWGAEAVGLPAILVRGSRRGTHHHCEDLFRIADSSRKRSRKPTGDHLRPGWHARALAAQRFHP